MPVGPVHHGGDGNPAINRYMTMPQCSAPMRRSPTDPGSGRGMLTDDGDSRSPPWQHFCRHPRWRARGRCPRWKCCALRTSDAPVQPAAVPAGVRRSSATRARPKTCSRTATCAHSSGGRRFAGRSGLGHLARPHRPKPGDRPLAHPPGPAGRDRARSRNCRCMTTPTMVCSSALAAPASAVEPRTQPFARGSASSITAGDRGPPVPFPRRVHAARGRGPVLEETADYLGIPIATVKTP